MTESENGARPLPGLPAGYDGLGEAKRLLRGVKVAALGTIETFSAAQTISAPSSGRVVFLSPR